MRAPLNSGTPITCGVALMSPWIAASCALLLVAATLSPAHAHWKWRDAKGSVHVSDMPPPPEIPERNILARPGAPANASAKAENAGAKAENAVPPSPAAPAAAVKVPGAVATAAKARLDPELEARRKKAEQEQQAKEAEQVAKRKDEQAEQCKRAQEQLRTFDSGMRIARVNAQGEREVLDDQSRGQETSRVRAMIAKDCR